MILSIDLGSTSFKSAVYSRDLHELGTSNAGIQNVAGPGRTIEIDPSHAFSRFILSIQGALSDAGVALCDIEVISITSQAQTFMICDGNGNPKSRFVSWQDTRSEEDNRAYRALTDFHNHSGVGDCLPMLSISNLAFMQDQAAGSLVQQGDTVMMLPSWFVLGLTGSACIDDNLAAMSGLYSFIEDGWWTDALDVCGISEDNMPSLVRMATVCGYSRSDSIIPGLGEGVPVMLAGNDQTAGAYAARIHESDAVLITLGTAQVAYECCDSLPQPKKGLMRGPYPGGRFYQLAADEYGGSTINWAKTVLAECSTDEAFALAAGTAPAGSDGLVFSATAAGGGGAWHNEAARHDDSHRARSILEYLSRRMLNMLDELTSIGSRPLYVAGGGSRCTPWVDILSELLGKNLQVTQASPTLGAARMARDA